MNFKLIISIFILTVIGIVSCSDVQDNISVNEPQGPHGEGVLVKDSPNFHGKYIKNGSGDFDDCKQCHASDFEGGVTGKSCTNCHNPIAIHQDEILENGKAGFHPNYMKTNSNTISQCSQCHGTDFSGGTSSPSCAKCHSGIPVHQEGIINPDSENFHGKFIQNIGWDLVQCQQCHGTDYAGGTLSPTCKTCHSSDSGPEACNTCHGDFNNPEQIYPPRDLHGNTETTYPGVGAHKSHLGENELSDNPNSCFNCHKNNFSGGVLSHIVNGGKADIVFDDFAGSDEPSTPAHYDTQNFTCQNTYCHGNFDYDGKKGNNRSVKFTKVDGSQAYCGSCHGQEIDVDGVPTMTPLPVGHFGSYLKEDCATCHSSVVDASGAIIDKSKHINREKNL